MGEEKMMKSLIKMGVLASTNDKMRNFFTTVFNDLNKNGEKVVLNKKYLKQTYQDIVRKKD